jgi:hypothetical protein
MNPATSLKKKEFHFDRMFRKRWMFAMIPPPTKVKVGLLCSDLDNIEKYIGCSIHRQFAIRESPNHVGSGPRIP